MTEYIYSRYQATRTFEETFLSEVIDAFAQNFPKYGGYSINQTDGTFQTTGATNTNVSLTGFLVSDASAPATFLSANTKGLFLAKTKAGTYASVKSADIYQLVAHYSRGSYIDDIIAEDGEYPVNGRQGDYWYVRGDKYSRFPSVYAGGAWQVPAEGFVKVEGVQRPIVETLVRVDGEWKTLV